MMLFKDLLKISAILLITLGLALAENEDVPKEKPAPTVDFEQVLKNYETKKQKELDLLTQALTVKLNQTIDTWLNSAKSDKETKIGSRIQQNWEKLASTFRIPPGHYEYSLRGYKYNVVKKDLIKTDSLTSPYKAIIIIKEELYVEKNHSPDISNNNLYFFTITTDYNLNFEYLTEKFVLANSENKIVNIQNSAPDEIKKYGKLF